MKKYSIILAALVLVMGLAQCKKQEKSVKQHARLSTSLSESDSKVVADYTTLPAVLKLTWENTDYITVGGGENTGQLDYVSGVGTDNAVFQGNIDYKGGKLLFYIGTTPNHLEQTATTITGSNLRLESEADYRSDGKYQDILMKVPYAILKLDLSAFGTAGGTTVTIKSNSTAVASVTNVLPTSNVLYVSIPTSNQYGAESPTSAQYSFEGNGLVLNYTWTLVQNYYYTKANGDGQPTGDAIVIAEGQPAIPTTHGSTDNFNAGGGN